jgi:hypothetical protein
MAKLRNEEVWLRAMTEAYAKVKARGPVPSSDHHKVDDWTKDDVRKTLSKYKNEVYEIVGSEKYKLWLTNAEDLFKSIASTVKE